MKHRLAMVGFGGMAGWHYDLIQRIDDLEVAGIWDIKEERRTYAEGKGIHVYKSEEDLMADPTVDIVLVATPNDVHKGVVIRAMEAGKNAVSEKPVTLCSADLAEMRAAAEKTGKFFTVHQNRRYVLTPNNAHAPVSIAAMKAGKHVMCEKPMAKTYAEAKEMVKTAKETGKILTIGYQNRYRADSQYLKSACEADELGEIYYAKAHAIRRRAVPTWGVFIDEEKQGGGPLIDIGTHALDLTLWMMNNYEPASVTGSTYRKLADQTQTGNAWGDWDPKKFTVEDSAFGFIKMKNGATIVLEASWALNSLDVDEAKTSLCGTKAGADMKDGLRINRVHHGRQCVEKTDLGAGGVAFYDGTEEKPADIEAEVFYNAVTKGTPLTVEPEQALVVTQLLEAIYESAKTGKTIYFD